jgi:hypothetical protein
MSRPGISVRVEKDEDPVVVFAPGEVAAFGEKFEPSRVVYEPVTPTA